MKCYFVCAEGFRPSHKNFIIRFFNNLMDITRYECFYKIEISEKLFNIFKKDKPLGFKDDHHEWYYV